MARLNRIMLIAIASICHEANRAYCKTLGDYSQPAWEDAPQWQKDSAIKGVELHAWSQYSSASDSHDSWYKEKEEQGWKYGPVKDPEKKEHPCFVYYNELPVEQQVKDFIFRSIVHAIVHESNLI